MEGLLLVIEARHPSCEEPDPVRRRRSPSSLQRSAVRSAVEGLFVVIDRRFAAGRLRPGSQQRFGGRTVRGHAGLEMIDGFGVYVFNCGLFSLQPDYLFAVTDLTLSSYDDNIFVFDVGFQRRVITLFRDFWLIVAWSRSCLSVSPIGCIPIDSDFSASIWSDLHRTQFPHSKKKFRQLRIGSLSSLSVSPRSLICLDFFLCFGFYYSFRNRVVISCTILRKYQ